MTDKHDKNPITLWEIVKETGALLFGVIVFAFLFYFCGN